MIVIFVVVIILAAFGSVYMLKPSPRQQRIARLRFDAIKQGMQVKLETFEVDSKKMGVRDDIVAARYELMDLGVKNHALRWCVVRQAGWEQEGLPEGWSWHNVEKKPDLEKLNALLEGMTDDVVVVEVYENRANVMTLENRGSSAAAIKQWIERAQHL